MQLPVGEFHVGRNTACDLVLNDGMVSRHHASLRADGGTLVIEDAGSRNGVRVNGMKAVGPRTLAHGDHVTIGSFEIVVFEEGHSSRERKSTQKLP
ncbi:MAG: FHA domain-containing protein, partial [Polyangiales bacterium]